MQILIWSIGKSSEAFIEEGIKKYSVRLKHTISFKIEVVPTIKNAAKLSRRQLTEQEGQLIISRLQPQDKLVALDENGEMMSTIQLSKYLQQQLNHNSSRLIFLIGGAYGLSDNILQRADLKLSLSNLTFPHQLVRLIICEQLYRAFTILNHQKYHHQ